MMQKMIVKKEVAEQVAVKLNKSVNRGNNGNLGEIPSISDDSINLPSSKNNFDYDDELMEHQLDNEIEKSYQKRIDVKATAKRSAYSYIRNYDGIEGKKNTFKGKNKTWVNDKKNERIAKKNLLSVMTEEFFNKAKSLTKEQIKQEFSDSPFKPILNMPNRFMKLFHNARSSFIHCGKQTLAEHIREHNDVGLDNFQDMQKILNNTNNVYLTNVKTKNNQPTYSFEVINYNGKRIAIFVRPDGNGNLIFWKSFRMLKNPGKGWKKINLARLEQGFYKSVECVQLSIHQTLNASSSGRLSAFPDNSIIPNSHNKSTIKPDYDGENVLHKSFDIVVTDITENNKRQKVEQVEKALNAMYTNNPFAVKHIKADSSPRYDDIILRISDFDRNKIEKAVHNMAFSLDSTVKNSKGEAFIYKAQEDLTDKWNSFFSSYVHRIYNFVTDYFGLPEMSVVRKSNDDLTYKGKVLYSPETGLPIKQKDWNRFVELLERHINRGVSDAEKRMILQSTSLGKILERMLKYNTLEAITQQRLEGLKYHGRKFEWISETVKNMESVVGELSRYEMARLQVMTQSAGIRITGLSDEMRMDVQQILIDGAKDRKSKSVISQNLFDRMVGHNRDFQRIADTEIQNAVNNGFLQEEVHQSEPGEKVYFKRIEIIDENTCPYCEKINGVIAIWSETPVDGPIKDAAAKAAIWEGKDWTGKKLSSIDEIPSGVCHPYCRGSWVRYREGYESRIDAMVAEINGKGKKWKEAVNEAKEEFQAKGIENPSDATKGYTDRINELYSSKLKKE